VVSSGAKNWVTENGTTPILDEGECLSFYAFSAIQAIESALRIS